MRCPGSGVYSPQAAAEIQSNACFAPRLTNVSPFPPPDKSSPSFSSETQACHKDTARETRALPGPAILPRRCPGPVKGVSDGSETTVPDGNAFPLWGHGENPGRSPPPGLLTAYVSAGGRDRRNGFGGSALPGAECYPACHGAFPLCRYPRKPLWIWERRPGESSVNAGWTPVP